PEPGHWYNPDQSGTGFNLEFQNGIMAGYYYGYDTEGDPEWYLVTGPLVRSETTGVMWELEVEPQRFTGGNCMGCPYQAPADPVKLPVIKIEFLQRAYARLTLSDDSIQYMVPIIYGDAGIAFFAEQTPYPFPRIDFNPYASLWTLVFKEFSEEKHAPWTWFSGVFMIGSGYQSSPEGSYKGAIVYNVYQPVNPPEVSAPFGDILCDLDTAVNEPVCVLIAGGLNPVSKPEFRISIGNFTDSRIFGETENGDTVQGYRLQYD
ncbi:MAG: hypothetical protein WBN41_14595, partial [Lysobacterales bacterium]